MSRGYQNVGDNAYPPHQGYNGSTASFGGDPFTDGHGRGGGGYSSNNYGAGNMSKETFGAQQQQQQQQSSGWMEGGYEPKPAGGTWKKWAIIAGVAVLIIAGAAGGIAGWKLSTKDDKSSGSSSASSSSSGSASDQVGSDPSKFELDSRLHQSFYGLAYSPQGAILPTCGASLDEVILDMQLLSQLTTRIRTYGSDCNASYLTMEAIRQTKVNMTVWLGIYISEDDTIWERQRQATLDIITEYGTDHISGITVGNEFLLNQANGAATAPAAAISSVTTKVAQFKQDLAGMSLSKTLPVGTADAGSMVSTTLAAGVDYFMANVHPWFGGVPINQAAGWTYEYYTQQVVPDLGTTKGFIAETGWPTDANATQFLTYEGAVASVPNLQTYLDTYVCQANANQTAYFYFEPKDEPWKEIYGGVEPYWGIFDKDRNLKDVTIPNCPPGDY